MRRSMLLLLLLLAVLVPGCTPTVRVGSPQHSCAPGFEPANSYGRLSARQPGPGAPLAWSVHPRLPVTRYVVEVYVDDVRVDHQDRPVAPHGVVAPELVSAGSVFRLEGQVATVRGVGSFHLVCRTA